MRRLTAGLIAATAALALAVAPATAGSGPNLKAKAKVKVENFDFSPKRVRIGKGDKVTWKNVQGRHTVTFRGSSYDKVISGDDKVSRKFRNKGRFKYICRFHRAQGMKGKVVVR